MKCIALKPAMSVLSLLFAAGQTGIASAHTLTGQLGAKNGVTDLYRVNCPVEPGNGTPEYLETAVADAAPKQAPMVFVQVIKGDKAVTSTDPKDGDAGLSPSIKNFGGEGGYFVSVSKTGRPAEIYSLVIHCYSRTGSSLIHTQTDYELLQNQ